MLNTRSKTRSSSKPQISIYLPMLLAQVDISHEETELLKKKVVESGGRRNASVRFVNPDNPETTVVRRGVVQFSFVKENQIHQKLDGCKFTIIMESNMGWVHAYVQLA